MRKKERGFEQEKENQRTEEGRKDGFGLISISNPPPCSTILLLTPLKSQTFI